MVVVAVVAGPRADEDSAAADIVRSVSSAAPDRSFPSIVGAAGTSVEAGGLRTKV